MTNLTAVPGPDSVPQIETTTILLGGVGGPMNAQAQALLNRMEYNKAQLTGVGGAEQISTADGNTVGRFISRSGAYLGRGAAVDLPRFMATIRSYRHDLQTPINIVGFGSSVGVGATLPDAATQAPVAWFKSKMKSLFDPGNLYNIALSNQSVNGSSVSDFPTAWAAMLAAGITTPGIALLAYGMNDQAVASYNAGQTFPGFYTALRNAVLTAHKAGWDVVIMTTPHPSVVNNPSQVAMPAGIAQSYPTAVAANVAQTALLPPLATSTITADFLGEGVSISVGHRALRINQAMRAVAAEFGCPLLDVERYWFEALQKYQASTGSAGGAESMLFNPGEIVHPNLLGHQESYQRAINDFVFAMSKQSGQSSVEPRLNGYYGVNLPGGIPGASLDIYSPYADTTTKPLSVKAQVGALDANGIGAQTEVVYVDPANGDLVAGSARLGGRATSSPATNRRAIGWRNYNGDTGGVDVTAAYSIGAGGTTIFTLPDNTGGDLLIRAQQPGVALNQVYANEFSTHNGIATLGVARQIGAGTEFTVSVAGLVVTVTSVFANTDFHFKAVSW